MQGHHGVWRRRLLAAPLGVALCVWLGPVQGQAGDAQTTLQVVLADGTQKTFSRADLERLPVESAGARLRDGPGFNVTGVSVTTLLRLSGLDLNAPMGAGQVVGHALIARAADGYRAVFGLADVDPHFGHPPVLVNWANADGSTLASRVGPFQLINTGESRPGRWVRQLVSLEVKSMP
jgi:hypothetical protein